MCVDTAELLNTVHTIMDKIRLLTQQISFHSSAAADIITQTNNLTLTKSLPEKLNHLKHITDTCCRLSGEAEGKIEDWIAMVCELVETCIESRSVSEREREEATVAYEIVKGVIESTTTKKCKALETFKVFER